MNLSFCKLLENNKDNLHANIESLSGVVAEFRKSNQVPEEPYLKSVILGNFNSCLMKTLKDILEKVTSQKRRKDFLQVMSLPLINEFYEKITMISSTM